MKKPLVTIIIPAYNEEKTIKKIVTDCKIYKDFKTHILVVIDNKTTDNTEQVAKKAGAEVVRLGKGLGKGELIRLSLPYIKGEYVVQIDADYQFLPKEIPLLIHPLFEGVDVTLGTRYQQGALVEKGSVSKLKLLGSYGLSLLTSLVIGQRITDVMAGFKAFKTPVLKKLKPTVDHFGYEAELVVKAAKKKYVIKNIPISYKKRIVGRSNVAMIKHGTLVFLSIISTAWKD